MKKLGLFLTAFFLFAISPSALFCQEEVPAEEKAVEEEIASEETVAAEELIEEGETVQEVELPKEEKEPEIVYQSFVDSVKKIRLLETNEDYFTARQISSEGRQLVNYANGKFQRRFYDKNFRLEKIEYWKQGATSAQSKVEKLLVFNLQNAAGVHSVFEKNYAENFEKRSFFYSDGRLKSERKNYFDKDGNLSSFDAISIKYDNSLRVIQERIQKYNVENKSVKLFSDEIRNSKYNGKILEETSYYKNSVLRVRTIYQNFEKGDYVKTTYFDGGIIVRDFYRENVKVDSSIRNGGGYEN